MDQGISLFKLNDFMIFQVYSKSSSKLGKDLSVTLHSSDIIASEKLVEFGNILPGITIALGNSMPFIKKMNEIKWWHAFTHEFVPHIFF